MRASTKKNRHIAIPIGQYNGLSNVWLILILQINVFNMCAYKTVRTTESRLVSPNIRNCN